jgi:RNA polymerase sigma-70 factor (TIGR02943 family)
LHTSKKQSNYLTLENNPEKIKTIASWVNLYSDSLYNWALSKTKSKELSEDLVQDTFISCFKSFDSFENRSNPKTWLIAILNNKIIDHFRKNSRMSFISSENNSEQLSNNQFNKNNFWIDNDIVDFWKDEESLIDNVKFEEHLKNCMNDLPEKWNLALTYKYLSDKKAPEICQELEISTTNYWQIVHRAKLLLKKCVETKWKV